MRLTLETPDPAGATRVKCHGQISQAHFGGPGDPLAELLGAGAFKNTVRLDLEGVEYVDSSGIGWLVGSHRRFSEAGGQLVLCRVPPVVEQILKFCGLENFFHVDRDNF
jgi:anti-sigma B factor antagonist